MTLNKFFLNEFFFPQSEYIDIFESKEKKGCNPSIKLKIEILYSSFFDNSFAIKVVTRSVPPELFKLPIKKQIFFKISPS